MNKSKLSNKFILISSVLALLLLVAFAKIWDLNSKLARLMKQITPTEITKVSPVNTSEFVKAPEQSKEEKYEVLKKLSVEVQIGYFTGLLGSPTYINFTKEDKTQKEHIYVNEDFYVQAITNSSDKVFSYAVTSRKKDFNPTFEMSSFFKVSLNKTHFSEWLIDKSLPVWCYRFLGAHDPVYYFEEAYFGNPGLYLTYLVGINNSASYDDLPGGYEDDPLVGDWGSIDFNRVNQNDRERITPNTFIVRSVLVDIEDKEFKDGPGVWFGPNNIQLRTLNE